MDSGYLDFTRKFPLDSFRINGKIATQAAYLVDPVFAILYLLLSNQHDFYVIPVSDCTTTNV